MQTTQTTRSILIDLSQRIRQSVDDPRADLKTLLIQMEQTIALVRDEHPKKKAAGRYRSAKRTPQLSRGAQS